MFWLICGWLLKFVGGASVVVKTVNIFVTWPRNLQQYKEWKSRRAADMHLLAREFRISGKRPKFSWFKRRLYRWCHMPCPHVWDWDDSNKPKCV
jgi:hypothetical protein